jgi:hypothetical protein
MPGEAMLRVGTVRDEAALESVRDDSVEDVGRTPAGFPGEHGFDAEVL